MSLNDRTLVCDSCKESFPQSQCPYWISDSDPEWDLSCRLCENMGGIHTCKCGGTAQFRTLPERAFAIYEDTVRHLMKHPRLKQGFQDFIYWYAASKEDVQTYYYALHEKIHICHEDKAKFFPLLEAAYAAEAAKEQTAYAAEAAKK